MENSKILFQHEIESKILAYLGLGHLISSEFISRYTNVEYAFSEIQPQLDILLPSIKKSVKSTGPWWVINGRHVQTNMPKISYDQLIMLAFKEAPKESEVFTISIKLKNGNLSVMPGKSIFIENGMIANVFRT